MIGGVKLASKQIITANFGDDTLSIITKVSSLECKKVDLKELICKENNTVYIGGMNKIGPTEMLRDSYGNLLVINSWDDSLFRIDLEEMILLESVKVGRYPLNIKLFNNKLYVLNADSSSLSIIDEKDLLVLESINLGGRPTDLTIDEIGKNIYITNYENNKLCKINIDSGEMMNIELPFQPLKIINEEDAIYILSFMNNGLVNYSNLSKINIEENKIIWSIRLKGTYYDFVKSKGKEYFRLIDSQNGYLYHLDAKNQRIKKGVYLGGLPSKIISDGENLYINDLLNDEIIILNELDHSIEYRVRVGKEPQGIFLL